MLALRRSHLCFPGCVDTLQLLLAAGASVDASNSKTGSPLLWAISTGRLESVKALLDAGASPNAVNSGGASALAMAAAGSKLEILHALLESGASPSYASSKGGITALHAAANAGSVDSISALLEVVLAIPALTDPADPQGPSAIRLPCDGGCLPQAGADTEARDDKGHKPLHEAAVSGHQKAVELLIGRTAPDPGVPGTEWTVDNILKAAQEANRKAKEEQAVNDLPTPP